MAWHNMIGIRDRHRGQGQDFGQTAPDGEAGVRMCVRAARIAGVSMCVRAARIAGVRMCVRAARIAVCVCVCVCVCELV